MLETAQKKLGEIRELALDPKTANFEQIPAKLQELTILLSEAIASRDATLLADEKAQQFFRRLPGEMARLRLLIQGPLRFYAGLAALRAKHFGSYERTGGFRSLEPKPCGSTVMHL